MMISSKEVLTLGAVAVELITGGSLARGLPEIDRKILFYVGNSRKVLAKINRNYGEVRMDRLIGNRNTYLACRTDTMMVLMELGFREVYNLLGGINAWIQEKQPVVIPTLNHD